MKFKYKPMGLTTGNISIVVVDDEDAFALGAKPGDRVKIYEIKDNGELGESLIVSIDIATGEGIVKKGEIGFYDEVMAKLPFKLSDGGEIDAQLSSKPKSFESILSKVKEGKQLTSEEIHDIIQDCTNGHLLPIEMAAFICGLETRGATDDEVVALTHAMAHSGDVLDFGDKCYDKHSTGGVPGNKITLIIVPIIAASGLFIPKTSTRAITSPSGTADSMEVLAPVAFSKEKVMEILKTEKVGILWGGAMDSAPADNTLINIEKPLHMDPFPLMIASIICKKMSMGVKKLVLDIPCGKGTKFPTVDDGRVFAIRFKEIAKRIGIDTICMLTDASQPIGHAVGPALEAREAIRLLRDPSIGPSSLLNKSTELAGILLEMGGKSPEGAGKDAAWEIVKSGKAYEAMKRIIKAQGGDPEIDPEKIEIGQYSQEMKATTTGFVTKVENKHINRIAKLAGCPAAKKSGIIIIKKIGSKVKKGDIIFTIISDSKQRLADAIEYYNAHPPQIIGGMTIEKI
ncbi:MAG: AMP phosphorylase [archaeon]|nr:AMP phosphorylase [archaeon]